MTFLSLPARVTIIVAREWGRFPMAMMMARAIFTLYSACFRQSIFIEYFLECHVAESVVFECKCASVVVAGVCNKMETVIVKSLLAVVVEHLCAG